VFGWVVTFEKAVVGCGLWKSSFDKAVVEWSEVCLVELLWLLEKSVSLTSRPHMSYTVRTFLQACPICHAHNISSISHHRSLTAGAAASPAAEAGAAPTHRTHAAGRSRSRRSQISPAALAASGARPPRPRLVEASGARLSRPRATVGGGSPQRSRSSTGAGATPARQMPLPPAVVAERDVATSQRRPPPPTLSIPSIHSSNIT
jgi:hypothetical protein